MTQTVTVTDNNNFFHSNKQANAFGNLGTCNELLKHYTQAIFCHNKVNFLLLQFPILCMLCL